MWNRLFAPAAALLALATSTPLYAQSGTLTALPNPCTIYYTQTLCSSTISWTASGVSAVQVWVSVNGGAEVLFASSGAGGPYSANAGWIQTPNSYVFRLYNFTGGVKGALLASRTVTATTTIVCPP